MSSGSCGLTAGEAALRLAAEGPNALPHADKRTAWRIVLEVLREPMLALLLAGGWLTCRWATLPRP